MSSDDSGPGEDAVDGYRRSEPIESQRCFIQSFYRRSSPNLSDEDDGDLLRAVRAGPDESQEIDVDFKGVRFDDETVFYLERDDEVEANYLRYGMNYFLAVYNSEVKLRRSQHFAPKGKYLFHVKSVNSRCYAFESLETGEHLHCDIDGKPFMKGLPEDEKKPKDHQAWFSLLSWEEAQLIKFGREVVNKDSVDGSTKSAVEGKSEQPGNESSSDEPVKADPDEVLNGNPKELREEHSEETDEGNPVTNENAVSGKAEHAGNEKNSEDTVKGNSDEIVNGGSEVLGERHSEDTGEGNPGYSEGKSIKTPRKLNSDDTGEKKAVDPVRGNLKVSQKRSSEDTGGSEFKKTRTEDQMSQKGEDRGSDLEDNTRN